MNKLKYCPLCHHLGRYHKFDGKALRCKRCNGICTHDRDKRLLDIEDIIIGDTKLIGESKE